MSVSLPLGCALLDEGSSALLEVLGADHAAHRTIADRPRLLVPVGAEDRNAMHGLLGLPNRDRGVGGGPLRQDHRLVDLLPRSRESVGPSPSHTLLRIARELGTP